MIVRTLERRFAVTQVLASTENEEVCVCRDLEEEPQGLYTLVRFHAPGLARELLPMLVRQQENPAFEDFRGLFTQDGALYARFRYSGAPTLEKRLEEGGLSLRERLEAAGSLLERMALQNMPPALQFEVLQQGSITVDDAMCARFNYVLAMGLTRTHVDVGLVCGRVEAVLRALFAPELSTWSVPELEEYLKRLVQPGFSTYLEIYGGYDQVRKLLLIRMHEADAVPPRTWLFRLWDRVKSLVRFVRPVLAGLVLVAAFCYLIYTLLAPPPVKGTPVFFETIGTVNVRNTGAKDVHTPQ